MRKEEVEVSLDEQVNTLTGVRAFIVHKVWPFVKDIFIDLFIELLEGDHKQADIKVKKLTGVKGFLARSVWPLIKLLFIQLLKRKKMELIP